MAESPCIGIIAIVHSPMEVTGLVVIATDIQIIHLICLLAFQGSEL